MTLGCRKQTEGQGGKWRSARIHAQDKAQDGLLAEGQKEGGSFSSQTCAYLQHLEGEQVRLCRSLKSYLGNSTKGVGDQQLPTTGLIAENQQLTRGKALLPRSSPGSRSLTSKGLPAWKHLEEPRMRTPCPPGAGGIRSGEHLNSLGERLQASRGPSVWN